MRKYLFFCCLVAAFGGFLVGFDNVFIGATPLLQKYFHLNDIMLGATAGTAMIGGLVGSLFSGRISYRIGIKRVFIFASAICILAPFLCSLTSSLLILLILRVCLGVAYGIYSTLPPIYLSEITPANIRGRYVTLYQLLMVAGSMLSFIVMYFLSSFGLESWRYMIVSLIVPSVLLFVALFFIPESPRWLVRNNKTDESVRLMVKLAGKTFAESELGNIKKSLQTLHKEKITDLFSKKFKKIIIIGLLLTTFQQLTGISAIFNFSPIIFQHTGAGLNSAFSQTLIIGVINFIFTIAGMILVDRWGRRPLLLYGLVIIIISLTGLSTLFYMGIFRGILALIFMMLFIASFAISAGPVMWVLLSEIFPAQIKGLGTSVATFMMWIFVGLTTFAFPVGLNRLGGGFTFALFAFITIIHFVFIWFFIPETKNKTLEEIESDLLK